MTLMVEVILTPPRLAQKTIVERAAFRRQGNPALLDFTKASGMRAFMLSGKHHRLLESLKAGLAQ